MRGGSLRLLGLAVALVSLLVLAGASSAAAGIRFAGPGGNGVDPCNDSENPCSIFTAADARAPGTTLKVGDEIILAPGEYSDTAGDLGAQGSGAIQLKNGVSLHGEFGEPRPVITLARPAGATAALSVGLNDVVSHIEIDAVTALANISVEDGGIVEDLIARSSAPGARVCNQIGGRIRDSVCLSSGQGGSALGVDGNATGSPTFAVQLRNVTAVATGAGSSGLNFKFAGSSGHPNVIVTGKGVIARGAGSDVRAEGLSVAQAPETGANVIMSLANSAYKTITKNTDAGGGIANVSPTGGATTNIEAEPLLAADGYHELAASPTIGRGTTDTLSGATDIDGQQRTIGLFADIGADEFGNSTATRLLCSPGARKPGEASTCTATVTDISGDPVLPSGDVQLTSSGPGAFSDNGVCNLAPAPEGKATCQLSYTPSQVDTGRHGITATYLGDEIHPKSQGHATIRLLAEIRFAAPGGTGADPCNDPDNPCSLFVAADETQGADTGDEIVLAPGNYSDAGEELGPGKTIVLAEGTSLHGQAGQPRPLITLTSPISEGLVVTAAGTVSHIEIESAVASANIQAVEATIEDVISRSSAEEAPACGGFEGIIRDSVCLTSGARADSLLVALVPETTSMTEVLRNVTAVASGSEANGLHLFALPAAPSVAIPDTTVRASGVIARGTEHDVLARSISGSGQAGTGANLQVAFDHSDYVTVAALTDAGQGTARVTAAGSQTNITAEPLFAADGFHQLPGSPTVDAGAADELSGEADIDGQPRTIGPSADIGADELLAQPTTTTVTCLPGVVSTGTATSCTATVADSAAESSAPGGTVKFASNGPGSFANGGACTLAPAGPDKATCQIPYTPSQVGSGRHTITASYQAQGAHLPSQGSAQVQVTGPNTPSSAPNTILKKKPRKKTARRLAKFTFVSDQPGSSFQCKLDRKPFRACRSPFKAKVKPGRHVLKVRAISPQGVADPTPAVYRWKVGKVKKKRHH